MLPIKIKLGWVTIEVAEHRLVVAPAGLRGRHFTWFFAPQTKGPKKGYVTPHVRDPGGQPWWLGQFRPESLVRFMQRYAEAMAKPFLAATRRVEPAELAEAKWVVCIPREETLLDWVESIKDSKGRYAPTIEAVNDLGAGFLSKSDMISPLALGELNLEQREGLCVARVNEEEKLECCHLRFFPHGLSGAAAGWYVTPTEYVSREDMKAILEEVMGPEVRAAIELFAKLLGLNRHKGRRSEREQIAGDSNDRMGSRE